MRTHSRIASGDAIGCADFVSVVVSRSSSLLGSPHVPGDHFLPFVLFI
jgi:hypothetical protein